MVYLDELIGDESQSVSGGGDAMPLLGGKNEGPPAGADQNPDSDPGAGGPALPYLRIAIIALHALIDGLVLGIAGTIGVANLVLNSNLFSEPVD